MNCQYDMSGAMLRWVLGEAHVKPKVAQGAVKARNLIEVNQQRLLPAGWNVSGALLDEVGFAYVPEICRKKWRRGNSSSGSGSSGNSSNDTGSSCVIHVHYHGCGDSCRDVSTSDMLQNGLAAYAESDNLLILYLQAAKANN